MAIFKCDSCGYERDVPDKLSGKKAKCPDCGHGVTIVDFLDPESVDLTDMSDDSDEDFIDEPDEQDTEASQGSIDLDEVETDVDLGSEDDVVCEKCGHVMSDGEDVCPKCGVAVVRAEDLPDPTEADVDLSDLAEEDVPQVWESDYPGNVDDEDFSVDDDVVKESSWQLFEGSLPLNIYAGLVSGLLCIFFAVAMALLAAGQQGLHAFLPYILASSLTGMAVASVFFALRSGIPFAQAGPETVLTAILFLFLGAIFKDMEGAFPPDVIAVTIVAAMALSSFVVGLVLWLAGKFNSAEFIRYIPLQIVGGVIGGIGVFVFLGTLDWIGPLTVDWDNLPVAVHRSLTMMGPTESLLTMGPSVVFGLVLFVGLRKVKNSLFLLGVLLVASAAGYAAGIWGMDEHVRSLAATVPHLEGGIPHSTSQVLFLDFDSIQWSIIKGNSLYIGGLIALAFLTNMFRVTRLEMLQGRESDLNREFKSLGLTNMVTGLCGGMVGNISHGRSSGAYATGARGPIAGIVAGLMCVAALIFVDEIVPFIPRFVPEGLLIFASFTLIWDWLFKARTAFTGRDDLGLLWLTFFVTVFLGILIGIGFAISLALIVTVRRSSKGGTVRNVLSGSTHRSNVDRAPAQQRTLKEFGDHIHILRLQGFLTLGSMTGLLNDIQRRLDDREKLPVEYLLLDFKLVSGIASSAGIGFDKLRRITEEYGLELLVTSAPLELEDHLEESGHLGDEEGAFKVFFNLDFALEWCENHVLNAENMLEMKQMTLPELLAPVFPEPKYIPALMKVLKRVQVNKGEAVFRQGDSSDSMYFVESGKLDVELELEGGKLLRLKKIGAGAVFGEMGIYTMAPRSATIRAAEKCVLYMMTTEKLDAVEKRAPMLVTAVNRYLINMLSERLGDANTKVRDLMT